MNPVQKAILPAFLVSSVMIVMLTRLIANPQVIVLASNKGEATPVAEQATGEQAKNVTEPIVAEQPVQAAEPAAEPATVEGCVLGTAYPDSVRQWCDLIQSNAQSQSLDPNLVAAVILQESGGNPDAYSHSGAVGLMQVMPRDGLAANFMCVNGPCFSSRPSMSELYDPSFNIDYGTRMLSNLISKHGDVREALRSYGPKDVGYYYADLVLDIYASYQ